MGNGEDVGGHNFPPSDFEQEVDKLLSQAQGQTEKENRQKEEDLENFDHAFEVVYERLEAHSLVPAGTDIGMLRLRMQLHDYGGEFDSFESVDKFLFAMETFIRRYQYIHEIEDPDINPNSYQQSAQEGLGEVLFEVGEDTDKLGWCMASQELLGEVDALSGVEPGSAEWTDIVANLEEQHILRTQSKWLERDRRKQAREAAKEILAQHGIHDELSSLALHFAVAAEFWNKLAGDDRQIMREWAIEKGRYIGLSESFIVSVIDDIRGRYFYGDYS